MSAGILSSEDVVRALKNCYDPEIPVNIVDLGLIYDVKVYEGKVDVKLTLTSQGCPAHTFIGENVRDEVKKLEGVKGVNVDIVWDPPWTPDRMSDFAKRQLGVAGAPAMPQVSADVTKPHKKGKMQKQEDGATVLVNDRNMVYKITPEVITFWEMCDGAKTVNQLADELAVQVKVDPRDVRLQIVDVVTKLMEAELLA
ncbi:MAG: PqqD family peptide modification chaperone [Candidatus Bathyarchaeia archaeon]